MVTEELKGSVAWETSRAGQRCKAGCPVADAQRACRTPYARGAQCSSTARRAGHAGRRRGRSANAGKRDIRARVTDKLLVAVSAAQCALPEGPAASAEGRACVRWRE